MDGSEFVPRVAGRFVQVGKADAFVWWAPKRLGRVVQVGAENEFQLPVFLSMRSKDVLADAAKSLSMVDKSGRSWGDTRVAE